MWWNDLEPYEELLRENRENNKKIMKSFDDLASKLRKQEEDEWGSEYKIFLCFPLLIVSMSLNIVLLWALIMGR